MLFSFLSPGLDTPVQTKRVGDERFRRKLA
jgi:hypothetical protein